ncbi:MAG TPA: helix-turn-helix domain-containing protein [Methanoregulaceae archaeon]|nr:helix-turn-helix domain-containing protein [Methanoregulaceae archaeon]
MTDEGRPAAGISPGPGEIPGTGKDVLILEPGDEQAQKIAKAMGSQTAADILQLLKTGPKTSTEVTETLHIPMGTAKYHIENLLDAGLIEITKTKYSVKGREVKIYGLKDQLVIVAPRIANVRSILIKYASLFGIVIAVTAVIGAILQMISPATSNSVISRGAQESLEVPAPAGLPLYNASGSGYATGAVRNITSPQTLEAAHDMFEKVAVAPSATMQVPAEFPVREILVAFFLGGCLVIGVLVCWELYQRHRKSRKE